MERITAGYEPSSVLGYFEDICRIPHGSGNEKGISDYLCAFAEKHGLEYRRDHQNNVLIKKPATPGYEDKEPVMLQGHMDMVCEKNSDTEHDFLTDPLDIYVKDGKLRARGTTLGGDDGIAVAYMLAILSGGCPHPDLECLITTGEETQLIGAKAFDYSQLKARRVINIDSEDEGEVIISCAGAADIYFTLEGERLPRKGRPVRISISGLAGGHSGSEIHVGHENAISLMGRLLERVYEVRPFTIASISGGNKLNAISRECSAEIYVSDREEVEDIIKDEFAQIKSDLIKSDKKLKIRVTKGSANAPEFTYKDSSAIINMTRLFRTGVITMSNTVEGLVRTSANLGRITTDGDKVTLGLLARSSSDPELDATLRDYARTAKLIGVTMEIEDRSVGWAPIPVSKLAKAYVNIYDRMYGDVKKPKICAIHAGLECGIIVRALGPGTDAISIGPDIHDIHTPDEALDLASTERTWNVLKELIIS